MRILFKCMVNYQHNDLHWVQSYSEEPFLLHRRCPFQNNSENTRDCIDDWDEINQSSSTSDKLYLEEMCFEGM